MSQILGLFKGLTYKPVSPDTPVNSYKIDGRVYTREQLSEATKQSARDTATIQRQTNCYRNRSTAVHAGVALGAAAYKAYQVGSTLWGLGLSGITAAWNTSASVGEFAGAAMPSYVTIGVPVGLLVVHQVTKMAINHWGKKAEAPITNQMRQRIQKAQEHFRTPQRHQQVVRPGQFGQSPMRLAPKALFPQQQQQGDVQQRRPVVQEQQVQLQQQNGLQQRRPAVQGQQVQQQQ